MLVTVEFKNPSNSLPIKKVVVNLTMYHTASNSYSGIEYRKRKRIIKVKSKGYYSNPIPINPYQKVTSIPKDYEKCPHTPFTGKPEEIRELYNDNGITI